MADFINHMPETKTIKGREYYRGDTYDNERDAELDKAALKEDYFVRTFWTGGETLSNGTIRKTYFLMVSPKP